MEKEVKMNEQVSKETLLEAENKALKNQINMLYKKMSEMTSDMIFRRLGVLMDIIRFEEKYSEYPDFIAKCKKEIVEAVSFEDDNRQDNSSEEQE